MINGTTWFLFFCKKENIDLFISLSDFSKGACTSLSIESSFITSLNLAAENLMSYVAISAQQDDLTSSFSSNTLPKESGKGEKK